MFDIYIQFWGVLYKVGPYSLSVVPYIWPYKGVTGVITPTGGVISPYF